MFLSTFEKQLDSKRRIVVPQEFRAATQAPAKDAADGSEADDAFDGIFVFPSIEADCIEGGGKVLFDEYAAAIEAMPLGDPLRSAMEETVFGGMHRLGYDSTGRITLPESLCAEFGITEWVTVVGLKRRFQIWPREAYRARQVAQRALARERWPALAAEQRAARLAADAAKGA